MPKITVIIPCYFNEGNIPVTSKKLIESEALFEKGVEFEYVLVDDGSKDKTWLEIVKFQQQYPEKVKAVKLVRNFSSTNAVLAGLQYASGDCNVVISADMQDPPELMHTLFIHWLKGYKLVVASRENREEPFIQSLISNTTHKLARRFAVPNLPAGGFDMCLFDKEVKEVLVKINPKNSYLPYMLMWLGYDFVSIPYVRKKREIGRSRYTFSKKLKTFIDSFVAFSYMPIRLISFIGILLGFGAFLFGVFIVIQRFTSPEPVRGWTSTMVVLLFVSSFQMIAMGIIGEYVWRALESSRNRPNFLVEKVIE